MMVIKGFLMSAQQENLAGRLFAFGLGFSAILKKMCFSFYGVFADIFFADLYDVNQCVLKLLLFQNVQYCANKRGKKKWLSL